METTTGAGLTGLRIRAGTAADGPALLAVHRASILGLGRPALTQAQCESWAHGLSASGYASSMAEGERFLVAHCDDDLVAFCSYRPNEIEGLFVHPDHARQGAGAALLLKAETELRSGGATEIDLRAALPAVPFYQAQGYVILRTEDWLTRGGEHITACDMVKTF